MTRVAHLFDGSAGWEQRVGVSQLLRRLPPDRYVSHVAGIDPSVPALLRPTDRIVEILPHFSALRTLAAPAISRFMGRKRPDLIHAWGVDAAAAARAATTAPLILQLYDPAVAKRDVRRLRTLARAGNFMAACSCETVRRRLVEGGFPHQLSVVIRPGVDFALINTFRNGPLREELGLSGEDHVVIVPEPVTRKGGQLEAVYAAMLRNHLSDHLRIVVPGRSREQQRIVRFANALPMANPLVTPGDGHPFEQLLAISDTLLVSPRGDAPTTAIAWAMAAGAAVIGTAVYAVAELIANKLNGLLFKQTPGRSMVASLFRLLTDRISQDKVRETARGQAYEVFGLRRCVEQHMRLYDNVLNGSPPGDGIVDSAIET